MWMTKKLGTAGDWPNWSDWSDWVSDVAVLQRLGVMGRFLRRGVEEDV